MISLFGNIRLFFDLSANGPTVNRAIYGALVKQIPLMYAIAVINMVAVAYTHYSIAPKVLTLVFPALLAILSFLRSVQIWRADHATLSDAAIQGKLVGVVRLSAVIGFSFTYWALALFQYGDTYMKVHVSLFLCVTVISSVFCLMHLKQAAVLLSTSATIPGIIVFALADNLVFIAIAANILLVIGATLYVLFRHNGEFVELVENHQKLIAQGERLETLNEENIRLANLDSLTGLPNRRNFFAELGLLISARETSRERLAVGLLDLDGFKPINDVFGHPAGDQLLVETGARLRGILDENIILARLGGDEFGIIVCDPGDDLSLQALGKKICAALQVPFDIREGLARISGTLGFATFPDAAITAVQLFERADYALCYSKQHSKGTTVLFNQEHETIIREVSNIEHRLREANLAEELSVVFQPIVDTVHNHVVGMEALARWRSPVLGNVPPDAFIRSAERDGSIGKLTLILLKKSLDAAAHWPENINLSFNLSALDLSSPDSVLRLMQLVQDADFAAHRVIFEITESAVMQDFDRANDSLQLIRLTGARIALDDFGTGFSSLSYVQRMPIDRIKIDRSFVQDIDSNKATRDIVRTILDLCRNLDFQCVVEGVETQAQLSILDDIGCSLVQGYYFSMPLPEKEALAYLNGEGGAPSVMPLSAQG